MTKLYSFQWDTVSGIFFEYQGVTWWSLSWVRKQFAISGSTTSVLKKFGVVEQEKKAFHVFKTSLVTFPKTTYFISKPALERILSATSSPKSQEFLTFLTEPQQKGNIQEVTEPLKKKSRSQKKNQPLEESDLTKLIFELLTLTKELTISLQMREPLSSEKKQMGRTVLKKLSSFL